MDLGDIPDRMVSRVPSVGAVGVFVYLGFYVKHAYTQLAKLTMI
jgi:hypothetical protein